MAIRIPNLEKQLDSAYKTINKYGKTIEALEKKVALLERDSHAPIEGLEERLLKLEKFKKEK